MSTLLKLWIDIMQASVVIFILSIIPTSFLSNEILLIDNGPFMSANKYFYQSNSVTFIINIKIIKAQKIKWERKRETKAVESDYLINLLLLLKEDSSSLC